MGRKYYSPEEFIRDHIARGFTAEQIISRAQKRDPGFIKIIKETLNHTTLIEKIENQVENHQQTQLDFENGNYSSKTLKDQISKKKANKIENNGRSNLPLHTDIQMDDLEAPLQKLAPEEKKVSFKNKPNKKSLTIQENNFSLFDEVDTPQKPYDRKSEENSVGEAKTEAFPNSNLKTNNESKHFPEPNKDTDQTFPLQVSNNEIISIQKELSKKNMLLADLNKNIGLKEAQIHSIRAVSEDKKVKLLKEIKNLQRKCFAYRTGFASVCVIFFISIGISRLKTEPSNGSIINTATPQYSQTSNTKNTESTEVNNLLINETSDLVMTTESIATNETDNAPPSDPVNTIITPPTIENLEQEISKQVHTVKSGDNWWKITKKYWGPENAHKYKKILEYNNLHSEHLKKGQVIKIPNLAELD